MYVCMKRVACLTALWCLLLSACGDPSGVPTPTPAESEAPQGLSYEEYFSQRRRYGDVYYGENELKNATEDHAAVCLAQELLPKHYIPLSGAIAEDCLYTFWALNEEGAYLYRLYCPTETLDLVEHIPQEELEASYIYTPQTEAVAKWLGVNVGEAVSLLTGVLPYSNREMIWVSYDREFLERCDGVMASPEDYPDYFVLDTGETVQPGEEDFLDFVARMETPDFCHRTVHYIDTVTDTRDSRPQGVYITSGYWWES